MEQDHRKQLRGKGWQWIALGVILLWGTGGTSPCYADETAGTLVSSKGVILFSMDGGKTWEKTDKGMSFPEGACVKAEEGATAALLLKDRSQIRLKAGSVLCLNKSGDPPGAKSKKGGLLNLLKGKLWFRNKRSGMKPIFRTPLVTASIRGTELALSVEEDGKTQLTVLEGRVRCANDYGEALIARGQAVSADPGAAPQIVTMMHPEGAVQWLLLTPEIIGPNDRDEQDQGIRKAIENAQEAVNLMAQGMQRKALRLAQESVGQAPESAAVHVALATVLQSMGDFETAIHVAEKGSTLDPRSVPVLVRRAELLVGMDRVTEAVDLVNGFQGAPDPRIDLIKGYLHLIRLNTQQAIASFEKVIEQRDDLATAYLGLGLAFYREGQTREALLNMEKASLLEPLAAYPHNYLGKAQYELGEREEAEVELKRAVELDPNDPTPHMYLATLFADQYRPVESVLALEKSVALNDNRLASRSRFLLDQDRAVKNISQAWSLSQLGLHEWAAAMGEKAVLDDQTNSAAYLFRGVESIGLGEIDTATLGDIKRADLLKPVNANTYISYTDYQTLLEIPEVKLSAQVLGGNHDTFRADAGAQGGNEHIAVAGNGVFYTTDGPFDGTGLDRKDGALSLKAVLQPGHQVLLDGLLGNREEEDLDPLQDGRLDPSDDEKDIDYWRISSGYHWNQAPGRDLLVSFQTAKTESDTLRTSSTPHTAYTDVNQIWNLYLEQDKTTHRIEGLQFFRLADHQLALGASWETAELSVFRKESITFSNPNFLGPEPQSAQLPDVEPEELRIYVGDIFKMTDGLTLDMGIDYSRLKEVWLDTDWTYEDEEEVSPKLGLIFQATPDDTIRLAGFKAIQPDYLSGTLQPVKVAGFDMVFGVDHGTQTQFGGIGWDRHWSERFFSRIEAFVLKRDYPDAFSAHPLDEWWREDKQVGVKTAMEVILTDQWACALSYGFFAVKSEEPEERKRLDHEVSGRLTWVHPQGWRFQTAMWFMDQDERKGFETPRDDTFVIGSMSLEKSLWDKKCLVFARWENIFDEEYTYLIRESVDSLQLPFQGTLVQAGVRLSF